jgi:hypothetical protein
MAEVKSPRTVSIIGTAGRLADGAKMSKELCVKMFKRARTVIADQFGLANSSVALVSGGAAWSDHLAVMLFLNELLTDPYASLTLHLPCKWDSKVKAAVDNGKSDWKLNPGRIMNNYHKVFSKRMDTFTLDEIETARLMGAVIKDDYDGFHQRNSQVAASDYLIAFTWGDGDTPKDGGTADTWRKSKSKWKVHVPLKSL